jgi:hypothetical protein
MLRLRSNGQGTKVHAQLLPLSRTARKALYSARCTLTIPTATRYRRPAPPSSSRKATARGAAGALDSLGQRVHACGVRALSCRAFIHAPRPCCNPSSPIAGRAFLSVLLPSPYFHSTAPPHCSRQARSTPVSRAGVQSAPARPKLRRPSSLRPLSDHSPLAHATTRPRDHGRRWPACTYSRQRPCPSFPSRARHVAIAVSCQAPASSLQLERGQSTKGPLKALAANLQLSDRYPAGF